METSSLKKHIDKMNKYKIKMKEPRLPLNPDTQAGVIGRLRNRNKGSSSYPWQGEAEVSGKLEVSSVNTSLHQRNRIWGK